MDYTLQIHGSKYIFPTPDGLKELSNDIVREVLRHQPDNICGFIADYLETMLVVRKNARDAGSVICDVFREGYFFDLLYRMKNINRQQANALATIIQASWRGYVVRRKISEWLKKKKKFDDMRELRKSIKIEELLAGLGISYDEATRAAGYIQTAYRESKRGLDLSFELSEIRRKEYIPFGQRIREGDRAIGRFDRWEKEDFGDFFEMDAAGAIQYVWPRVGQLRKVPIEQVPSEALIVQFYGMRDLDGHEQYSYLIKSQPQSEIRGVPVGFLIPFSKTSELGTAPEVNFVNAENAAKMGNYTYIFRDDVERDDLEKFEDILKARAYVPANMELHGEFDYDPYWVLPRVLVRIKKNNLLSTDDEVKFASLPEGIVCEQDLYTFRAESLDQTGKIIRYILRDHCLSVIDALVEASNLSPYKVAETGRIFPVNVFSRPEHIQKIRIIPESLTGNEESLDVMQFEYIFLPTKYRGKKNLPKSEGLISIPIVRFEGFHSDYRGSADLVNQVFVMGPKLTSPNGKPLTYESLFWDEFGVVAWHHLITSYAPEDDKETESEIVTEHEIQGEATEAETEEEAEAKVFKQEVKSETPRSESAMTALQESEPSPEISIEAEEDKIIDMGDSLPEMEGEGKLYKKSEDEGKMEKKVEDEEKLDKKDENEEDHTDMEQDIDI